MSTLPISFAVCCRSLWLAAARGRAATIALPLAVALGCGGSGKGATDPAGVGSGESAIAWKDKTRAQRMDWMGLQVFPQMKAAFKEFDANRFSEFECQTCHSEEMEIVNFKMPNTKIYALPVENTVQSAREYDEQVTDFMLNVVTPKMAELLDMPVYNPETKSGFGCFGCHPTEG